MENIKKIFVGIIVCFIIVSIVSEDDDTLGKTDVQPPITQARELQKFPALIEPKVVTFRWEYENHEYEITETLNKSVYDYYRALPKTWLYYEGEETEGWEDDYYSMFLNIHEKDNTISQIVSDIIEEADKQNLSEDQTVELVLAFVQSIPYDQDIADKILIENIGNQMYPYEVLYENRGVCGGTSLLAAVLFKEMGYGAALFSYDKERHLAVGVQCPEEYSTYSSGYCYAETTTAGHRIGIIPELDLENNSATFKGGYNAFGQETTKSETMRLSAADIYVVEQGKTYNKITETLGVYNRIEILEQEIQKTEPALAVSEKSVDSQEKEVESVADKLDYYESMNWIALYNNLVPEYNKSLKDLDNIIDRHNSIINNYNNKIFEINKLYENLYTS